MGTICAWCHGMIEKLTVSRRPAATSHGICKACLKWPLESLPAAPPARAA